jgi:hypothetical protein
VNVTVAPSFTEVEFGAIAYVTKGVTELLNAEASELTPEFVIPATEKV